MTKRPNDKEMTKSKGDGSARGQSGAWEIWIHARSESRRDVREINKWNVGEIGGTTLDLERVAAMWNGVGTVVLGSVIVAVMGL
jgi:hypothetical protein